MVLNKQNIIRIGVAISAILILLFTYRCGQSRAEVKVIKKEIKVTETKIDTIRERIKGDEVTIIKYVDKVKEIEKNKVIYDTIACKEIVAKKDSIIAYKDSIIGRKDSIIFKERVVIQYKDTIIEKTKELPCKKKLGFGAGFVAGVVVGGVGGVFISK